jgi:hypothetical protein
MSIPSGKHQQHLHGMNMPNSNNHIREDQYTIKCEIDRLIGANAEKQRLERMKQLGELLILTESLRRKRESMTASQWFGAMEKVQEMVNNVC